jgi:hypothetical protein
MEPKKLHFDSKIYIFVWKYGFVTINVLCCKVFLQKKSIKWFLLK